MKFIKNIIYYYLIVDILLFEYIKQEILSANLNKTNDVFILKLYKNSNTVASKLQIYSSLHNKIYLKYK